MAEQGLGYLEWLATGRRDPSADIGLVFLFFYGLEFRLFKEGAARDSPRLIAEIERLLDLYGSPSFQGYARRFLEAARLSVLLGAAGTGNPRDVAKGCDCDGTS